MLMKNLIRFFLPLVVALVFGLLGASKALQYRQYRNLGTEHRQLQEGLQIADAISGPRQAIDHYKTLRPSLPEIQLRILQRQWLVALDILHQIQLVKYNAVLDKEVPVLFDNLQGHLQDMKDRCNLVLTENDLLPEAVAWRIYNIKGSVNLLSAFIVLETERNWKKVMGTMKDAISDLKLAIAGADKAQINTEGFERNIPRWNLELLHGEQYVKKFKFTKLEAEQRLELRDNLEAIIPEKGGYAPGEPVERKVEK
jgi:hypothetical protein